MERADLEILGTWQHLLDMVMANATELSHLEASRGKLASQLSQAQELKKQQATMTASKQEASKQLRLVITEGQRLANALRGMIKAHYGIRTEKLAEFGMQPFRGRNRKPKTPDPETTIPTTATHADPKV